MNLKQIREKYKEIIPKRIKDNNEKGINFVVEQCLNEMFDEIVFGKKDD